jgi:integrase
MLASLIAPLSRRRFGPALAALLERAYVERDVFYRGRALIIEATIAYSRLTLLTRARFRSRWEQWRRGCSQRCRIAEGDATLPSAHIRNRGHRWHSNNAGISMVDAGKLLGHSDASMVAKRYGHAVQANMTRGVALTDAMIAQTAPDNVTWLPPARIGDR